MRLRLWAFALTSNLALAYAACSSDDSSNARPDGGSSDAGIGEEEQDPTADAGVKFSPTGCPLKTTGHRSAKKAENLARAGAANWTNPQGALSEDGAFAQVTLNDGQESAELRVSDFGFDLPATVETWGITVELKRRTVTDGGFVQTGQVNVEIEGKTTNFKFDSAKFYWPTKIIGRHEYGQAVDTWGADLFPADVNKPTFAAKLWARRVAGQGVSGPVTATIESLKVAIWYCEK
jgi:hypothetical protein